MKLGHYVRERAWPTVLGYGLFVATMAAGYYYNVTFVQLGLLDLGTRLVGLSRVETSLGMAGMSLATVLVALATGVTMDRRGWSGRFFVKLRLLFTVVCLQFVLTAVAPFVRSPLGFAVWLAGCALSIGVGMPVTFGLAVDLVPVPDRGAVAAAITAVAFFAAALYPLEWDVGAFSRVMVAAMAPAVPVLGLLAFRPTAATERLARQHERREFGVGRFVRGRSATERPPAFWLLLVLMFGVFFVDSLGFLRIVETPTYVEAAWQSPDVGVHLTIAVVHLVGALMAGVLYRNFGRSWLFLWAFGVFAVTHLLYTFGIRLAPLSAGGGGAITAPLFYALAVSFYTTLNFALWADLSTPETVGTNAALGVGVAGFLATFLSTATALYLDATGVSAYGHLNLTNALAIVLLLAVVVSLYVRRGRERVAAARRASEGGDDGTGAAATGSPGGHPASAGGGREGSD